MIPVTSMHGKRVALFGLGGSGIATALALGEGGADVIAFDDNPGRVAEAQAQGIATCDLRDNGLAFHEVLVLAPGVPLTHPEPHWSVVLAQQAGVPVIGDIELFARERRARAPGAPFVAITGTNGKSTTTALVAHVLTHAGRNVEMGGNIGRAALSLEPPETGRIHVLECSSYQIDLTTSLDPIVGLLLNLSPDHLDRHGSMENYAGIKERLVAGSATAIIGMDDDYSASVAAFLSAKGKKVIRISGREQLAEGVYAQGSDLFARDGKSVERVADLSTAYALRGEHNAQNAAAAFATCRELDLSAAQIQAGFDSFGGLAHRMEVMARVGNTLFVNDSKATNANAAARALASFDSIYWIAGGLAKDGGIASLADYFDRIAKAYLIGEAAPEFAATLSGKIPFEISGTIEAAVNHAARDASADNSDESAILLSPACASFDQYANFEQRGEDFRRAVLALDEVCPMADGASL